MPVIPVQVADRLTRVVSSYAFTAAAAADEYQNTGREVLRMRASGAATVTITQKPDPFGRGTTQTIVFGGVGEGSFGPATPLQNWNAADGNIDIAVDTPANMSYGVERLPNPL